MFENQAIVLKVGGSLFDLPDLGPRVLDLLRDHKINQPLLVTGGGETAELIRKWHEVFDLSEEVSHDLAVNSLTLNNLLLLELIPGTVIVGNREEAEEAWQNGQIPILNCAEYLKVEEPKQSIKLPHTWSATSDSIAAWVAINWPSEALILLKSTVIHSLEIEDQSEYVDPEFKEFIPKLNKIGWCSLRSNHPEILILGEK